MTCFVLIGLFAFAARRISPEGISTVLGATVFFLLVLLAGSTYGGIRHALPIVVLLATLGGTGMQFTFSSKSIAWKAAATASLAFALISAFPVMRPWEYFNEIIGGASRAWPYFSDEGVDLGQRVKERADYYHRVVEPSGEIPLSFTDRSVKWKKKHAASIGSVRTSSAINPGSNRLRFPAPSSSTHAFAEGNRSGTWR